MDEKEKLEQLAKEAGMAYNRRCPARRLTPSPQRTRRGDGAWRRRAAAEDACRWRAAGVEVRSRTPLIYRGLAVDLDGHAQTPTTSRRHASMTALRSKRSSVAPAWPAPSTKCNRGKHCGGASRAIRLASSSAGTLKSAVPATIKRGAVCFARASAVPAFMDGLTHSRMRWRQADAGKASRCGSSPTTRHA